VIWTGDKSAETQELRRQVSAGCEKLIWDFFEGGGQVVIYDANNGTRARRQALAEKFDKEGIHVVMLGLSMKSCSNIVKYLLACVFRDAV
jgi:predicted kinase